MKEQLVLDRRVIDEVSPADVIHRSGGAEQYFHWGSEALKTIERFLAFAGATEPRKILDLPSGYGRILRYLESRYPDAEIQACDIDSAAVDFCARVFGATPVYSTPDLGAIPLDQSYDLIWCGSLLTHVHADQWRGLLRLFADHLGDHGVVIFTTHGRPNVDRLRIKRNELGLSDWSVTAILSDYEHLGFGYQNFPNRDGYGISLSSAAWVCEQIQRTDGLRLAGYQEGGWGGMQDAVACVSTRQPLR